MGVGGIGSERGNEKEIGIESGIGRGRGRRRGIEEGGRIREGRLGEGDMRMPMDGVPTTIRIRIRIIRRRSGRGAGEVDPGTSRTPSVTLRSPRESHNNPSTHPPITYRKNRPCLLPASPPLRKFLSHHPNNLQSHNRQKPSAPATSKRRPRKKPRLTRSVAKPVLTTRRIS